MELRRHKQLVKRNPHRGWIDLISLLGLVLNFPGYSATKHEAGRTGLQISFTGKQSIQSKIETGENERPPALSGV